MIAHWLLYDKKAEYESDDMFAVMDDVISEIATFPDRELKPQTIELLYEDTEECVMHITIVSFTDHLVNVSTQHVSRGQNSRWLEFKLYTVSRASHTKHEQTSFTILLPDTI
jgi:hypothetical protein